MLRSFIAVQIPEEIRQAIVSSISGLQRSLPRSLVRWVTPKNIHLTLQFLGDVSPANLDRLALALKPAMASYPIMDISVAGLGAFPSPRRARVLWIGLDAPPALEHLCKEITSTTAQMKVSSEDKRFSPHLTIGRIRQDSTDTDRQRLFLLLQETKVGELGRFTMAAVDILKSDLYRSGPVYTRLHSLPLKPIGLGKANHREV